jgi:hypothetical protein
MCLNGPRSKVRFGKHLSDTFPFSYIWKQGDFLSPLLFKFALEYVISRVQINHDGFKLNGTLQLLVNADDATILVEAYIL